MIPPIPKVQLLCHRLCVVGWLGGKAATISKFVVHRYYGETATLRSTKSLNPNLSRDFPNYIDRKIREEQNPNTLVDRVCWFNLRNLSVTLVFTHMPYCPIYFGFLLCSLQEESNRTAPTGSA